ncbi:MAG: hypothetical protein EBS39_13245, partial [Gammaproteobacteria bacterium]|nr:hypothetical protein [Gammaproteobacteria bacterium]
LAIRTNNAERVRVLGSGANAGFVGIGVAAPTALLDVNGAFRARGASTLNGSLGVDGASTFTGLLTANGGITTNTLAATTSVTTPLVTNAGTLALSATGANIITASTNGAERLRIDANGQVGIGMTPGRTLDVTGTFGVTGATTLAGATQVNNTLGVTGATTLSNTLTVSGASQVNNTLGVTGVLTASAGVRTPSVTNPSGALSLTATGGTLGLAATGANPITLATNGVERLRVDSVGRVGIGTNNPTAAQLMIVSSDAQRIGLLLRGALGQESNFFEVQANDGTPLFSVNAFDTLGAPNPRAVVSSAFLASGTVTLSSIAGATPGSTMGSNDRIVVADPNGTLSQVSPGAFVSIYAWGLKGNTGSTSSGVLGGAPAPGSNFIGTLD